MSDTTPNLTIVVPTFKEAGNITPLTERIFQATNSAGISAELIFVDDDSQDGTDSLCNTLASKYNVRLIVRKGVRGLATAVIHGLREANGRFLLSMDGDLSHPPAAIPEMFRMLTEGADFVIGSRYVTGGCIKEGWALHRWLNSKVATLLARPLTAVSDPMSGFFALPKIAFLNAPELSPLGYKVALELLVKVRPSNVIEIPIQFEDRKVGTSKLCARVQFEYLKHLRWLYRHRYPFLAELVQFLLVGSLGLLVDLSVYSGMQFLLGVNHIIARSFSFLCATTHNWFLNRRYTFLYGHDRPPVPQWISYLGVMLAGFILNVGTYVIFTTYSETFSSKRYSALIIGVGLSTTLNFLAARYYVFKKLIRVSSQKPREVTVQ